MQGTVQQASIMEHLGWEPRARVGTPSLLETPQGVVGQLLCPFWALFPQLKV